jgi:hypothetical protein
MDNRIIQTPLNDPGIRDNGEYGDISRSQIMSKFEETDYVDDENSYYTYSRQQASDFRPDPTGVESEQRRGGVNGSSRMIQLRIYGDRSSIDANVERPDLFLALDSPDPRGVATIPDFSGLRAQEQFRTKYTRFSKENDQAVTGGGISESQGIEMRKFTNIWKKDNLKIFERSLDGRQEGFRRQQSCESNIPKVEISTDYGEAIKSDALNPTFTTKTISRNSNNERTWRTSVWDQDIDLVLYSSVTRKGGKLANNKKVSQGQNSTEQHFTASNPTQLKRAAKQTMKQITQLQQKSDSEFCNEPEACRNRTMQKKKDLGFILGAQKQDGFMHTSNTTMRSKTPIPTLQNSQIVLFDVDHDVADINRFIISKSVSEGNIRNAQKNILQSSEFAKEDLTRTQKTAVKAIKTGTKLDVDGKNMEFGTIEGMSTKNYKAAQQRNLCGGKRNSEFCALAQADISQIRRSNTKVGRFTMNNVDNNTNFLDNKQQDRRKLRIGAKYTPNYTIQRETGALTSEMQSLS